MKKPIFVALYAMALGVALLTGCGDDGSPEPVTAVDISVDSARVEISQTLILDAIVSGGESKRLDWYVNGILGGDSEGGTVTWSSPATGACLDSIRVAERPDYGVVRIWYATGTVVENCHFVVPDDQQQNRGIEFNTDVCNTVIRNCSISGFSLGIAINNTANPLIEGCTIENNRKGVHLCCAFDPRHNPNPDLGGGARGSSGGNIVRDNTVCGLENGSSNVVFAKFNTWGNDPPIEGEDFLNTGTGSIVWQ